MSRFLEIARAEPGLLAVGLIAVIGTLVLGVIALMMRAAGESLRPIAWFAVFMAIILGPQALVHAGAALGWVEKPKAVVWRSADDRRFEAVLREKAARAGAHADTTPLAADLAALGDEAGPDGPRFRDPARVFGPDVGGARLLDLRAALGALFAEAQVAQGATWDGAEAVYAARFRDAAAAARARVLLLAHVGVAADAVPTEGAVTVRRPWGSMARVASAGPALFLWTAADDAALTRRFTASAAAIRPAAAAVDAAPEARAANGRAPLVLTNRAMALVLPVLVLVAALWFFKGSAWAARVLPAAGTPARSAAELRARLVAASGPDAPWTVTAGDAPDELVVTWRYADARWLDLAGAHGVTRVHRLVLRLDEDARAVRVREQWSRWSASAGRGGASLDWHTARGITFFERRAEVVLGLSLDALRSGEGLGIGMRYRFDASALKAPFRRATTDAGWSWRPLVWDAPTWLRWATE